MHVKDIMTRQPAFCRVETGLREVAAIMRDHDIGAVPVVDSARGRPVGIITDRDIVCRALALGKNPLEMSVGQCMTQRVISITPESSLEDCLNLMEKEQVRRVLVVDQTGQCIGIVAQADVALHAKPKETAKVVKVISSEPAVGASTR